MNSLPLWSQIVIAFAGGGLFAGLAGVISSIISSRQKIKEIKIAYQHQIQDAYLENARKFIDSLYLPINISLSLLNDKFEDYENNKQVWVTVTSFYAHSAQEQEKPSSSSIKIGLEDTRAEITEALNTFRQACWTHIVFVNELYNKGLDAYFTTEIDERLSSFTHYLKSVYDMPDYIEIVTFDENDKKTADRIIRDSRVIGSEDFSKRFETDIRYLKSCIKQVTLGKTTHI